MSGDLGQYLTYYENISRDLAKEYYGITIQEAVCKFSKVRDLARNKFGSNKDLDENIQFFEDLIAERAIRRRVAIEAMQRHGLEPRDDSYMTKRFVFYNEMDIKHLTYIMWAMDILHKKCDIIKKWEAHKAVEPNRSYPPEEKDAFYFSEYNKHIREHPEDKFIWKPKNGKAYKGKKTEDFDFSSKKSSSITLEDYYRGKTLPDGESKEVSPSE